MSENIKRYRSHVIIASSIFFFSIVLGMIHSALDPSVPEKILSELQPLAEALIALEGWKLAIIIFVNNSVKILGSIVLGIFFGLFPIFSLLVNGYLIGIIAQYHGSIVFLAGIVPHGIFEIPALLLGAGAGIHLGVTAIKKRDLLKEEITYSLKLFFKVIIPLLLAAALIETFLTPIIMTAWL